MELSYHQQRRNKIGATDKPMTYQYRVCRKTLQDTLEQVAFS